MATPAKPNLMVTDEVEEVEEGWLAVCTASNDVAKEEKSAENPYKPYIDLLDEKDQYLELARIRIRELEETVKAHEETVKALESESMEYHGTCENCRGNPTSGHDTRPTE
ncbi:hypothetical protein K435DRAFT_869841 [Dendrothele bispora CBS 962.96]|uniref:Uncharacterized protein n=1 Tax=Dendrothele bispora (strain CBS 962.96) TaxID=1314807 RepID=A0A4S8KRV3_DENBC|nr:hypothetical protein K435DRAFT_876685 [Dendrothele bispora CBS 962.96]THU84898.1 hypothetical protein K435DRAFT_869841 [Dendrothele bispora CBS 962.96]